jgi:hypothetical protein
VAEDALLKCLPLGKDAHHQFRETGNIGLKRLPYLESPEREIRARTSRIYI